MGAKIAATPDGRSFYVAWGPNGPDDLSERPVIVTLHDAGATAFDTFFRWHPYAEKRGCGLVAVQWEFGRGEDGRFTAPELYAHVAWALAQRKVQSHCVLLHGLGAGATLAYGLTWLDVRDANRFFALTLADGGAADQTAPAVAAIASGRYGTQAYIDTHWVLFCGLRHSYPDPHSCDAIAQARTWIQSFGGTVEKVLMDPDAADRGIYERPEHMVEVFKVFDRLVARQ